MAWKVIRKGKESEFKERKVKRHGMAWKGKTSEVKA
jgi:hypothetical protein